MTAGNRRAWTVFTFAFLGVFVIQSAWMLVVPPFRGLDEHDHAFKAAAVANGDWSTSHERSTQGWGEFVAVPTDLVQAARPVCEMFRYTTPHNCRGVGETEPGTTRVASSAARYNPVFYWVMGTIASPFEGAFSLYAMRIAAMVMCAILVALAVTTIHLTSRSPWPAVGLVCALTPTATYTFSVAAPNGVEMAAGFLLWSALLRIAQEGLTMTRAVMAVTAAVPLTLVRGMGPVWVLLIVATVLILVPRSELFRILRSRIAFLGLIPVLAATLYASWWTLVTPAAAIETQPVLTDAPWSKIPAQWALWFLQSIAAFPARDEFVHSGVYLIVLVVWWLFIAVALRVGSGRERLALAVILTAASAVPILITLSTYDALGAAWQGRYSFPYAAGFFLVCGHVLDRAAMPRWAGLRWPLILAAVASVAAHVIAEIWVLAREIDINPLAGSSAWLQPSPLAVPVLNAVGFALLARAMTLRREIEHIST